MDLPYSFPSQASYGMSNMGILQIQYGYIADSII